MGVFIREAFEKMENTTKELHTLRGELTLAAAVCINSLGVVLMLYSGAGISAISSVPFAFSEVLPRLTARGRICFRACWC